VSIRAVEDFDFIRRELLRNRVVEAVARGAMSAGTVIPKEVFVAAGYTEEEYARISDSAKRLPLGESDLR
jgi:hypothetical protein